MNRFFESLLLALSALKANFLRSILTTLGIIVGVASVIAVISIMKGFSTQLMSNFENLGSNTLVVEPYVPLKDKMRGKRAKLTYADYQAIQRSVEGLEMIVPLTFKRFSTVSYKGDKANLQYMMGTISGFDDMNNFYPVHGRFLIPSDNKYKRKVILLGADLRKDLKLPQDPSGEYVQIETQWYKVIGEMEKRDTTLGFSQDNMAIIPFQTALVLLKDKAEDFMQFMIKVEKLNDVPRVRDQLTRLLRKRHSLKGKTKDDFTIKTSDQIKEQFENILDITTYVVAAIVGVSLIVGGIGIMNIMLVSVTERTREIGICKALGATRGDILTQFLAEAIILCLLGGLIGITLGVGIGFLVGNMIPGIDNIYVPAWAISLSLGFSSLIGIIFGIVPASKAANLDPIEALHYE